MDRQLFQSQFTFFQMTKAAATNCSREEAGLKEATVSFGILKMQVGDEHRVPTQMQVTLKYSAVQYYSWRRTAVDAFTV